MAMRRSFRDRLRHLVTMVMSWVPSTSGNSQNVVAALETARIKGLITVAFSGATCGKMAPLADYLLAISSKDTARIQEAHLLAGHMICDWIESDWIQKKSEGNQDGATGSRVDPQ